MASYIVVREDAIRMAINATPHTIRPSEHQQFSKRSQMNKSSKRILNQRRRRPWFIWLISIAQIAVFIAELGKNWSLVGSPIQIKPVFNPLIGPSPYLLINMGARFSPCMHAIPGITDEPTTYFPCPNSTNPMKEGGCTLSELCGFDRLSTPPNQWYRFIIPIFLHGGVLHIGFNLFSQLTLGAWMEKEIGILRMTIIYFASGIFGFVFGGNFLQNGFSSVGCSGSLFGIIAVFLLHLLYTWHNGACCQLILLLLDIIVSFGLGLLPTIDNFSHVGGFLMGLLLGLTILGSPNSLRRRQEAKKVLSTTSRRPLKKSFSKRSRNWWIWWVLRMVTLAVAIVIFVLAILNFYSRKVNCNWCRYISCLPVQGWCDIGYLTTSPTHYSSTTQISTTTI